MQHHNSNRKFGRVRNQRKALLRSLAFALIMEGKITTTESKAKELRPYIERMVTKSKTDTVAMKREVDSYFGNNQKQAVQKLLREIGPRYKDRSGGYTRITKLFARKGDARSNAQIEFV